MRLLSSILVVCTQLHVQFCQCLLHLIISTILGIYFQILYSIMLTYLLVEDNDAFRHEFFVRLVRSFPLLKYLRIFNIDSQLLADPLIN
jgi:hypothetical protein